MQLISVYAVGMFSFPLPQEDYSCHLLGDTVVPDGMDQMDARVEYYWPSRFEIEGQQICASSV